MTRKSREAKPVEKTGGSELAAVLKDIGKVHGDNVVMTADMKPAYKHIPFNIFALDMATFGGLPEGACTLLYGWESSGKTTLTLRAIAAAQKKYPKKRAVLVEPEGTLDPVWARTHGVDTSKLILVQPTSGEQAFDIARAMVQAEDVSMVAIDSLAALVPNVEKEKSMEDGVVGNHAKLIARFCRTIQSDMLAERTRGHRPALLLINQWRYKIGVTHGDNRVLPGGVAQHFCSSVKIEIKNREITKDGNKPAKDAEGHSTVDFNDHSFAIKKNKMGVGLREGEFKMCRSPDHPLGMGTIDDAPLVVTWCRSMGLITGSGSSWHVEGIDHRFTRLQEIADHFYDTPEFYGPLKQRLIEDYREKIGQPRGYL